MNQEIMRQAGFSAEVDRVNAGKCATCAKPGPHLFRDSASSKEYRISGMCQGCQDSFFGADTEDYGTPTGSLNWEDLRKAWSAGLKVLAPVWGEQDLVITLDIDKPKASIDLKKLGALKLVGLDVFLCASKSGNTHGYVCVEIPETWRDFPEQLQTVAATLLGSDPVREFLSAARARNSEKYSHLMFETQENAEKILEMFPGLIQEVTPEDAED